MSPEVSRDNQNALARVAEVARRLGSAVVHSTVGELALVPTVVSFDHFPGESRQFERRDFPGFRSNPDVSVPAA